MVDYWASQHGDTWSVYEKAGIRPDGWRDTAILHNLEEWQAKAIVVILLGK